MILVLVHLILSLTSLIALEIAGLECVAHACMAEVGKDKSCHNDCQKMTRQSSVPILLHKSYRHVASAMTSLTLY